MKRVFSSNPFSCPIMYLGTLGNTDARSRYSMHTKEYQKIVQYFRTYYMHVPKEVLGTKAMASPMTMLAIA